jgi:hypothetical protein
VTNVADRPTSWWLGTLRRRAEQRQEDVLPTEAITFATAEQRTAAVKFFNAAYRAEESGLSQAFSLAQTFSEIDPELGETLRLYGEEEGWHRSLLTEFLGHLGAGVKPMGRVTTLLYDAYARARRMDTILLTNLMFETIGSTTYRMTLARVDDPSVRAMLAILTRDEAFHVPLNVHFLKRALAGSSRRDIVRLRILFHLVFLALVALPLASRPKSKAFDGIGTLELSRAYARELGRVFLREPGIPMNPPSWLLAALGIDANELRRGDDPATTSVEAAELAADRERVQVTALS